MLLNVDRNSEQSVIALKSQLASVLIFEKKNPLRTYFSYAHYVVQGHVSLYSLLRVTFFTRHRKNGGENCSFPSFFQKNKSFLSNTFGNIN